ncbi:2-isopropylmalate synthase [Parafrankia irregularis]|uniref:2-isopropylmalate synthase n=2 Tax=Frankiaceae TaxID=74712 RepID=A0A0S4QME5_9ACTN|nr:MULTISPECIES: 2-isopropylmalate synthase [Parafrankia]CUU56785.1 2-isopropylmalate synthase [Parafrankia irregularis]
MPDHSSSPSVAAAPAAVSSTPTAPTAPTAPSTSAAFPAAAAFADAVSFPTVVRPRGALPAGAAAWNAQRPSSMPHQRYLPIHERVELPAVDPSSRIWPTRRVDTAPLWVSVDLRDGNQALREPMDTPRKRMMFDLLVAMGFKEIEVGYPSASQTDFDFVRHLVEDDAVPPDVTTVVFTPARRDLIERTFEAIAGMPAAGGMPRVVVHLYVATAPVWRQVVLGHDRADLLALARDAAEHMARLAESPRSPDVRFQFSPEVFNATEPDFALEICNSLSELWDACPQRPVIHNLPATVEISTPNVYADQIEYMDRHLARRESVILSVHPHNDRGTGVACAELALLAGAQRVEGCLFGNGERTGNVDLVTLALNLYSQGVNPMIDFSDIDVVRETVEHCNRVPVHPRHPYGGELAYTAFSGTHQDAISKGLAHHAALAAAQSVPEGRAPWAVPYLPIDPADVGRSYEALIRVNSQSGKGGIAHLLNLHYGLELPRGLRADFSRVAQEAADRDGRELVAKELWEMFQARYLAPVHRGPILLSSWRTAEAAPGEHEFVAELATSGGEVRTPRRGIGNGPLAALTALLAGIGVEAEIVAFSEHAMDRGGTSLATAYIEIGLNGTERWGVGQDTSALTASVNAVIAAVNGRLAG